MRKILLPALVSATLTWQGFSTSEAPAASHADHHGHMHHEKMHDAKMPADMMKECEEHLSKIKDTGAMLPPDMKAEFDYHLKIASLDIEALKDPNHKDPKVHAASCHRHLRAAGNWVKKHERTVKQQERKEAHERRIMERKAQAEERKAKREAAKAAREAAKAEHMAAHHLKKEQEKDGLDHGTSEGADKKAPGSDVGMPLEKK